MATLSLLPLCFASSASASSQAFNLRFIPSRTSVSVCHSPPSSSGRDASTVFPLRRQTRVRAGGNSKNEAVEESMFMDENGVIDDMDGYLNYLSPEYESVWDTKPSWCQPWTITLTGVLAISFSWVILQSVLVTAIVGLLICSWWYIFLYSYPKAYTDMIAERRRRIKNGTEDTFGFEKVQ